jgi:hypothetical protein
VKRRKLTLRKTWLGMFPGHDLRWWARFAQDVRAQRIHHTDAERLLGVALSINTKEKRK